MRARGVLTKSAFLTYGFDIAFFHLSVKPSTVDLVWVWHSPAPLPISAPWLLDLHCGGHLAGAVILRPGRGEHHSAAVKILMSGPPEVLSEDRVTSTSQNSTRVTAACREGRIPVRLERLFAASPAR